jgi:hypothetical protein
MVRCRPRHLTTLKDSKLSGASDRSDSCRYPNRLWTKSLAKIPWGELVSLASQKSYMALHMICFYGQPELLEWFKAQYAKSGKKLDMGKGCLRFKALADLALDVVESTVARLPVSEYVAGYQAMRDAMGKGKAKPAARTRTPAKKGPARRKISRVTSK